VNGGVFNSGAVVQWNGTDLATTFVNSTRVRATVPAMLAATPGTANVSIVSSGISSGIATVTISAQHSLNTLAPSSAVAGASAFPLTVNGSNFMTPIVGLAGLIGPVVRWNGNPLPTTFVSATQLRADVAANLLTAPGTASVTVVQNGIISNALNFVIQSALTITSPNALPAMQFGSPYNYPLTASGGSGAGYAWTGTGGPNWLSISSAGVLTGTPPLGAASVSLTVRVTDSAGNTASKVVTIASMIITATLPGATIGSLYSQQLQATGGSGGYTWFWSATPLVVGP
jgi:hypothetical protein